jgi:integrase
VSRFSVFRRGKIYYARIYNPQTKRYEKKISTGQTSEKDAWLTVAKWDQFVIPQKDVKLKKVEDLETFDNLLRSLKLSPLTIDDVKKIGTVLKDRDLIEGITLKSQQAAEFLSTFLLRFWDYEASPYVREKKAHFHSIGRRHCLEMTGHVKRYWNKYRNFEGKRITEVKKQDLDAFTLWLSEEKKLAPKTINNTLLAGSVAFGWMANNGLIVENPAKSVTKFSVRNTTKKRGILSLKEAQKLFSIPWSDERSRLGNLLAALTGLRAGEILALQIRDIGDDRLFVRHSFSNADGLKSTKTGEEREVPFKFCAARKALLTLARKNPHGTGPTSFIFWSDVLSSRPMDFHFLLDGLKDALKKMGMPEKEIRERNIVFHSWRHFFTATMAFETDLNRAQVKKLTGHKTDDVFNGYADHTIEEAFQRSGDEAARVFGKIAGAGGAV